MNPGNLEKEDNYNAESSQPRTDTLSGYIAQSETMTQFNKPNWWKRMTVFEVPRVAYVYEPVLGISRYLSALFVSLFFLALVAYEHSYLAYEEPKGSINVWTPGLGPDISRHHVPVTEPFFCDNSDYRVYEEFGVFDPNEVTGCENWTAGSFHVNGDEFDAITHVRLSWIDQDSGLPYNTSSTFIANVEDVGVSYQISASTHGVSLTEITTDIFDSEGNLWRTVEDGGKIYGMKISDFLYLANSHLDEPLLDDYDPPYMKRTTGVILLLRMNLYNYAGYWPDPTIHCDMTVHELEKVWGLIWGWDTRFDPGTGHAVYETMTTAVRVIVRIEGQLGYFNLTNFLISLTSAVVSIQLSVWIVHYVVMYSPCVSNQYRARYDAVRAIPVHTLNVTDDTGMKARGTNGEPRGGLSHQETQSSDIVLDTLD